MQNSDRSDIIYEHSSSERIGLFLRLETFFRRTRSLLDHESHWTSRMAVEAINDTIRVLKREDLQNEIIKEIEHQSAALGTFRGNPNVAKHRLDEICEEVDSMLQTLHDRETAPGHELRHNALLKAVRDRDIIVAGACNFDLPAFHFWLEQPAGQRLRDLRDWLSAFDVLESSIGLCLRIVRGSTAATHEVASRGFLQRNLGSSTPCRMIRIALSRELALYPVISDRPPRSLTVRFFRPGNNASRSSQTDTDVDFGLYCCII